MGCIWLVYVSDSVKSQVDKNKIKRPLSIGGAGVSELLDL
jgi:hypothetical protein